MCYVTGNEVPKAVFKQTFLVYGNGYVKEYLLEMAHVYTVKRTHLTASILTLLNWNSSYFLIYRFFGPVPDSLHNL